MSLPGNFHSLPGKFPPKFPFISWNSMLQALGRYLLVGPSSLMKPYSSVSPECLLYVSTSCGHIFSLDHPQIVLIPPVIHEVPISCFQFQIQASVSITDSKIFKLNPSVRLFLSCPPPHSHIVHFKHVHMVSSKTKIK